MFALPAHAAAAVDCPICMNRTVAAIKEDGYGARWTKRSVRFVRGDEEAVIWLKRLRHRPTAILKIDGSGVPQELWIVAVPLGERLECGALYHCIEIRTAVLVLTFPPAVSISRIFRFKIQLALPDS